MAHKFPSGFFVVDVNDLLIPVAVIKSALLLLSTRHNNNGGSHIKELAQDIHQIQNLALNNHKYLHALFELLF